MTEPFQGDCDDSLVEIIKFNTEMEAIRLRRLNLFQARTEVNHPKGLFSYHHHEKLIARNQSKNLRDLKIVSRKFSSILQQLSYSYNITPNEFGLFKNLDIHLNSPT